MPSNGNSTVPGRLTDAQRLAAILLARGLPEREVAAALQTNVATLRAWRAYNPAFQRALNTRPLRAPSTVDPSAVEPLLAERVPPEPTPTENEPLAQAKVTTRMSSFS